MLGLKKILYEFQYALIAVPIVLAIIAASKASIILSILSILLTVTDVAVLPVCKNNENVWTFFMIALTVTPINIKIIVHFIQGNINLFIGIVMGLLLYFIMLSIEEIIVGVIVRIIRSKQCDFDDMNSLIHSIDIIHFYNRDFMKNEIILRRRRFIL